LTIKQVCKSLKNNGDPCSLTALPNSDFCFSHDPVVRGTKAAGRKKKDAKIDIPKETDTVISHLKFIISRLRNMENTPETMRAYTSAISTLDKAIERRTSIEDMKEKEIKIVYINDWRQDG